MDSRSLMLALILASPMPALAEEAAAPVPPETRLALTGDFVELGTGHPGISRSLAAVEIVNRCPHPIDVKLGYGSGRVEPKKTLHVRIEPGEQPLEISSPAVPGDQIVATLTLEKGRAYALGVAWERVLLAEAPAAGGRMKAESAPAGAMEARPAASPASVAPASKKTRSGRVDVGRKRKRDR